jgi:DNA-binding NarL/FixJ family response regulator
MKAVSVRTPAAMAHAQRIRLLLVDDHPLMRAGLANLLQTEPDFLVVAQADDGEAAIDLYRTHKPDVCLLDVTMHGIDGIETLRRLRQLDPATCVLMLTSSEAPEDIAQSMKAGACGYVTKTVRHEELVKAIHDVHQGRRAVSADVAEHLAAPACSSSLSPREIEVLGLMREGFTNNEIGRLLGISTRTAKAHVAAVIEKIGVGDRTQAVARAFDLGLLRAVPARSVARKGR